MLCLNEDYFYTPRRRDAQERRKSEHSISAGSNRRSFASPLLASRQISQSFLLKPKHLVEVVFHADNYPFVRLRLLKHLIGFLFIGKFAPGIVVAHEQVQEMVLPAFSHL